MRNLRLAGVAAALFLLVAGAVDARAPTSIAKHCKAGTTSATIAGKHVCLKPGARCSKKNDRAYHRYRFHCHSGRLTRFPAPAPKPEPPTLAEPPAPAGQLVDVGGYRLHLECTGIGSPTVVIEPGDGESRHGPRQTQYALAADTRVCTYDRPGTQLPLPGSSDARPPSVPPTSGTFSRELHTLLANANVPGPYLLVGASFGGLLISAFTAHYPADVAGLAFLDAGGPADVDTIVRAGGTVEPWDARPDLDLIRGVDFGARPVVVLTTTLAAGAADIQRRSTNVLVAGAPQYSHFVFKDVPGLAYETVRVAIAAVRAGGVLPRCAATRLPQVGARCPTP
jgi:pimeloyl-ACP methyl ester carboxylesterase